MNTMIHTALLLLLTLATVSSGSLLREICGREFEKAPVVLITSTSNRITKGAKRTIFQHHLSTPIWIFSDNSWDMAHGRGKLNPTNLPFRKEKRCITDIFQVQPFLTPLLSEGGAIDEFYQWAGDMEPCDQPLRIKSGKLLVRKLAAMEFATRAAKDRQIILWLDTDTSVLRRFNLDFVKFVRSHDISFIPFTNNEHWGDTPVPNFEHIEDPLWRIESGVVAVNAGAISRAILGEVISMYQGELLKMARQCIEPIDVSSRPGICKEIWFMRNIYLDDIFVFSMVLHKNKYIANLGWFITGGGACKYPFLHIRRGAENYTSPFSLDRYVCHYIGHGAYSKNFREEITSGKVPSAKKFDDELVFKQSERFNDTVEFRFPGATPELLHDSYWPLESLQLRQYHHLWPENWPLQHLPTFPFHLDPNNP